MMRVLILGSTGMLGSATTSWFMNCIRPLDPNTIGYIRRWFMRGTKQYQVHMSYRDESACLSLLLRLPAISHGGGKIVFDCLTSRLEELPDVDYVINCIGTIKPFMAENPQKAIEINSVFPWRLAEHCAKRNTKLIHITTDCVFSGKKGHYTEADPHDALDDYGKSKSIGEPSTCMVLRTSIIGEEIHKNASLVEWVKGQKGNEVNGYTNHLWNGITTKQYAKICDQIIRRGLYETGKFHVMSPNSISKHKLVTLLGDKYDLGLTVKKFQAPETVDRTLGTVKNLSAKLFIPPIEEQIGEM